MSSISKVAVAGATGNIGPPVVQALLAAGFQVTALTRGASSHALPSTVVVKAGVIETAQRVLLEATVKAQVKRFLLSEYGSNSQNEKSSQLLFFLPKRNFKALVEKKAAAGNLEYTMIVTGPFLDMCIKLGLFMNLKEKSTTLYDEGNRLFSTTTIPTLGKSIAEVLKHPEQTKNRTVYVQEIAISQRSIVEIGKKATGPEGWKEEEVPVAQLIEEVEAEKNSTPLPFPVMLNCVKISVFGEEYGGHFEKLDNELLGIKELTEADVQRLVDAHAQQA